MLTFVFLMFMGLFAVAGVFISIEAKRRKARSSAAAISPRNDKPTMGRATGLD
jgi:cbb3-type cytochrome oxidase subunit 3